VKEKCQPSATETTRASFKIGTTINYFNINVKGGVAHIHGQFVAGKKNQTLLRREGEALSAMPMKGATQAPYNVAISAPLKWRGGRFQSRTWLFSGIKRFKTSLCLVAITPSKKYMDAYVDAVALRLSSLSVRLFTLEEVAIGYR